NHRTLAEMVDWRHAGQRVVIGGASGSSYPRRDKPGGSRNPRAVPGEAMPPLVSVIIPTLDEEQALGATLDAVAGLQGPVEVLVVDGGSQDATVAVARRHGAVVVQSECGRGLQLAAGARTACGEVLWFLHADARPATDAVACLHAALGRRGVVGGY